MLEHARACLERSIQAKQDFAEQGLAHAVAAAEMVADAMAAGNKLLIFGNGGSAADAQHMAAEFTNRFIMERPPLPALALTTDSSALTAIGNDYHFDEVFVKQVKALGNEGDVALGISTSGRSSNVLNALNAAKAKGLLTIGLAGNNPGAMDAICDIMINAPSEETPRVQEIHGLVVHLICELVDLKLFGRAK
jgi:D-sedoheptulose 7-phosphate isomerase